MTTSNIPTVIHNAIQRIAPEVDLMLIDRNADLREECDLDSMDFLNLITAIKKHTGIVIPEKDYARVRSYNQLQAYLEEQPI